MRIRKARINESDLISLLDIYQQDFLYRHTIYWNLFYKSMFAILGLLSIPYFLYQVEFINFKLLAIFPILSFIINIFSIILLESESVRMKASRERLNSLSPFFIHDYYKQISVKDALTKNNKISLWGKFLAITTARKILFLNILLILFSVAEIIFILYTQR